MKELNNLTEKIETVVDAKLDKFAADRVAMTDYALHASGGKIVKAMTNEINPEDLKIFSRKNVNQNQYNDNSLFNTLLNYIVPRSKDMQDFFPDSTNVIKPSLQPGECWAFPGSKGQVTIKLIKPIKITHVTLDHAHKKIITQLNSAPNEFKVFVWKLEADGSSLIKVENPILTAAFNIDGPQIQTWEVTRIAEEFLYITLEIVSNHGNTDYTCVYRFRVHSQS